MKKLLFNLIVLLPIFLQSCSPALQSGGWLIPVGLIVISAYSFIRHFSTILGLDGKGGKFSLICGVVTLAAGILSYVIMGIIDK